MTDDVRRAHATFEAAARHYRDKVIRLEGVLAEVREWRAGWANSLSRVGDDIMAELDTALAKLQEESDEPDRS